MCYFDEDFKSHSNKANGIKAKQSKMALSFRADKANMWCECAKMGLTGKFLLFQTTILLFLWKCVANIIIDRVLYSINKKKMVNSIWFLIFSISIKHAYTCQVVSLWTHFGENCIDSSRYHECMKLMTI